MLRLDGLTEAKPTRKSESEASSAVVSSETDALSTGLVLFTPTLACSHTRYFAGCLSSWWLQLTARVLASNTVRTSTPDTLWEGLFNAKAGDDQAGGAGGMDAVAEAFAAAEHEPDLIGVGQCRSKGGGVGARGR